MAGTTNADWTLQVREPPWSTTSSDWAPHLPAAVLDVWAGSRLRRRLDALRQHRPDLPALIQKALGAPQPLPVENPADALWWRIVAADASTPPPKPKPGLIPKQERPREKAETRSPYQHPDRSPGVGR